ncbi:LacI family DNA-binding transcriptional regulator [Bifidobacterium sp. ESL0769]|uniref:LacI family DNA-binding transcriptional regulator n=1 Tax=Bifidobacterium sp. ESL0769 TaxID=2983229 RepID=UPI0023F779F9|nr:LacI family DNA-binding transcriptional regulator [Bifidobacterium sp. ESL0769]WEV67624.1 LacI family DNA-binding transcriptional regulator [Bifidobacterium sp. ESL0769]
MRSSEDFEADAPNNSIVEVAALAEVSTATVSRVLSGRRRKNDDIAKKVRRAAATLHYSGNSAAKALRSKISNILAIVMPKPIDFFSSQIISELEPAAKNIGKDLLVALAANQQELDEQILTLATRGIDGLIVIPPAQCSLEESLCKLSAPMPIVQLTGQSPKPPVDLIGIDVTAAMHEAVTHLADRNATSIAFLSPNLDSDGVSNALIEFQSSDQITKLIREPEWTTFGARTIKRGYEDALRIFNTETNRPDGIICGNDQIALGALEALQQLHITVPQEVGIVSFGDSPLATMADPPITSVKPPYQAMVTEAMRLILQSTHHFHPHTTFPPEIVARESTSSPRIGVSDIAD